MHNENFKRNYWQNEQYQEKEINGTIDEFGINKLVFGKNSIYNGNIVIKNARFILKNK